MKTDLTAHPLDDRHQRALFVFASFDGRSGLGIGEAVWVAGKSLYGAIDDFGKLRDRHGGIGLGEQRMNEVRIEVFGLLWYVAANRAVSNMSNGRKRDQQRHC